MDIEKLRKFAEPYYKDKDIMHNMWHIGLVGRWVDRIIGSGGYSVDYDSILYAIYFHGFIYSDEAAIRMWLIEQAVPKDKIEFIIKIAWESQRPEVPGTTEGKILHDAHVLEGGVTYQVVKTLITGSVRGQTLPETINYIKNNVIDRNTCYLPETIVLYNEMNNYTKNFIHELEHGIC